MARVKPFRRLEIDSEICQKITKIIKVTRYRGSFTSFVESILDDFAEGLLVQNRERPGLASYLEKGLKSVGHR